MNSSESTSEIDSVACLKSLQLSKDEYQLHQLLTSEMTNTELSIPITTLELDNEQLRINLENAKIELDAKNAANQGLKNKIAELHIQAQLSLQEKQQLHNSVKDAQFRLNSAENSTKWYQGQMHEAQASKKMLQIEVKTYQIMLKQKHETLVNISSKWKQLNEDYLLLVQKHKKEKNILQEEIRMLKMQDYNIMNCSSESQLQSTVPKTVYNELSSKLEIAEKKLQDVHTELHSLEVRLTNSETLQRAAETTCTKQNTLLSSAEDSLKRCESKRIELANVIREMHMQLHILKSENQTLQTNLLVTKQEHGQVEYAIEQLQSQLTKMIVQHKLLKSRNAQLQEKLIDMQDVFDDNNKLKSILFSANTYVFKRLRQQKKKTSSLQKKFYCEQSKCRRLGKDSRNHFKLAKTFEESFDEGYADCRSTAGLPIINFPSPQPLKPELLKTIDHLLSKSENFWEEIQIGLKKLHLKFEKFKAEQISGRNNCFDALQLSISTPPLSGNEHCIA